MDIHGPTQPDPMKLSEMEKTAWDYDPKQASSHSKQLRWGNKHRYGQPMASQGNDLSIHMEIFQNTRTS